MRRKLVILAVLLAGGCSTPTPKAVATWTYPVWGLPRDLADAPLTAINRTGFGTYVARADCDYITGAGRLAFGAADVAGLAAWISHGFGAGVVTEISVLAHGLAIVIGSDLAYGFVVNPLQVALLRTGIDDRFVKLEDHDESIEPGAAEAEARVRSRAFFPNWRFLVCDDPSAVRGDVP